MRWPDEGRGVNSSALVWVVLRSNPEPLNDSLVDGRSVMPRHFVGLQVGNPPCPSKNGRCLKVLRGPTQGTQTGLKGPDLTSAIDSPKLLLAERRCCGGELEVVQGHGVDEIGCIRSGLHDEEIFT